MVQSVNTVRNINTKQSFGCKDCEPNLNQQRPVIVYNRPSTTDRIINAAGKNFIAGALISAVFDGVHNGVNYIRKTPQNIIKFSDVAKRAGIWGACWVAASAVLALVFPNRR